MVTIMVMKDVIPAGKFKARCLKLMDEVQRTRRPLTITKRGKAVARLVPASTYLPLSKLFGHMSGSVTIKTDIVAPSGEAWNADV